MKTKGGGGDGPKGCPTDEFASAKFAHVSFVICRPLAVHAGFSPRTSRLYAHTYIVIFARAAKIMPVLTKTEADTDIPFPPYSTFIREQFNNAKTLKKLMKPRFIDEGDEWHEGDKAMKEMKKPREKMKEM